MKKKIDVARAWRDEDYYLSLTDEERASLGDHPAGAATLEDDTLRSVAGGCGCDSVKMCSAVCTPCGRLYCI